MSLSDEFERLFSRAAASDGGVQEDEAAPAGDPAPDPAEGVPDEAQASSGDMIDLVRKQLEEYTRAWFYEEPEGVFNSCGVRFGVGFAEPRIIVDPQTGLVDIEIDTHLVARPEQLKYVRKILRHYNSEMQVTGYVVEDDGRVWFRTSTPVDVRAGGNIGEAYGKSMSSVHAHANIFLQLAAGVDPWDVLNGKEG